MSVAPAHSPDLATTRIGLIIPSVNATIEPEFYRVAPRGFSFHSVRIMLRETTPSGLRAMNQELDSALELLVSLAPSVIAYACTSGSFLEGPRGLEKLVAKLRAESACPVVATSAAMLDALRHLEISRLALATPYIDSVNEAERGFLEDSGFQVVACRGLGLSGTAIREVQPERVRALALEADHADAQALFISCTDLRALETVADLEKDLGKPVLTSNQVTLWALLRICGHDLGLPGLGRLLAGDLEAVS